MFGTALISIIFASVAIASEQTASLKVLKKAPSYYKFDSSVGPLSSEKLDDLLLAISGLPIDQDLGWKGIKKTESASFPSVTLAFVVPDTDALDLAVQSSFDINNSGEFDLKSLETSAAKSKTLVKSLDRIPTSDDLKSISQECGQSSSTILVIQPEAAADLSAKINQTVSSIQSECASTQNGLFTLVISLPKQHRSKRQAKAGEDKSIENPAEFYRDQYPAIFNILFWLSLILAVVIYAIAYNMWYMDPGLDTVIYRMTSQRIKKDQ